MKINLIISSFYPATVYGGPIFSTLYACEALSELDDIVVYVSTTNANREKKLDVKTNKWIVVKKNFYVKYYNITFHHTISLSMFFNIWKDIKKADIIQIQSIFDISSVLSVIYSLIFKKPMLLSPRGSLSEWSLGQGNVLKKLWLKLFILPFVKAIDFHATSVAEKDDILTLFPKSRVHVVPNGISTTKFSRTVILERNKFTQNYTGRNLCSSKIITTMGRLHYKKGFDILINSFSNVIKSEASAILLIAGKDVGEQRKLFQLVEDLSLENSVFFVGEVSGQDKIDFFANSDLFVLPSHSENFGNVYLESLAAGTPIIASKGTPWQEVETANCGKWVNNTVEETTTAILEMLNKDREEMRANSINFSLKYDWKNIAIEFKNVFDKIVNGKSDEK